MNKTGEYQATEYGPSPETDLKISIIIPVYKGGDTFRCCVKAMERLEPSPEEIIVVADGGFEKDNPPDEQARLKIIETPFRGGPAKARNIGARAAKGDILLFIDADVVVEPDIVKRVREIYRDDPELTALMGSYDDNPGQANFLSQYRNLLHHYVHQNAKENASTFWGACGAVKRKAFLDLGGFDEKISKPAMEDIEIGYRMKQHGYRIRLCKNIQVKHLKRWEAISILKTDFFQRALPWTELILKYRHFSNDLNIDTSSRVSVMLTFCLILSFLIVPFWPKVMAVTALLTFILLYINADLYKFFYRKRGLKFTLMALPWHWLYFFYSGLGFLLGLGKHKVLRYIQGD